MGFGNTASKRREAARKHSQRKHICWCAREIYGNAYYRHKFICERDRKIAEAILNPMTAKQISKEGEASK